ncbi:MAG: hypothetical protein HYT79_03140 [Elusimicrobia bacterium]|nr:hypothetical protein [Elusimicrobiota bacterium]
MAELNQEQEAKSTASRTEALLPLGKNYFYGLWHFVLQKALIDFSVGVLLLLPAYLICAGLHWIAPLRIKPLTEIGLQSLMVLGSIYVVAYILTALFRTYKVLRFDLTAHSSTASRPSQRKK